MANTKKDVCANCTHYEDGRCTYYEKDMAPDERCLNWSSK